MKLDEIIDNFIADQAFNGESSEDNGLDFAEELLADIRIPSKDS